MKILIWGNKSQETKEIITKLKRENQEVYVIYDEKHKHEELLGKTYEEYYLEYQSKHILTIIRNISPDISVFMLDPLDFVFDNSKFSAYVSGLSNAVLSSKQAGVKHFLFRSSVYVFGQNNEKLIHDTSISTGTSDLVEKLQMLENMIGGYASEFFKPIILRCAEVYSNELDQNKNSIVNRFIRTIKEQGTLEVSTKNYRSCIHYKDMCEAFFRLLLNIDKAGTHLVLAPLEENTEQEIITLLKEFYNFEVDEKNIVITSKGHQYDCQFFKSIGFEVKYSLKDGILDILSNTKLLHDKLQFHEKKKKKWFTLLEIAIAFVITQGIMLVTSEADFHNVIDLYSIYVLIIAVTYGGGSGMLAVILSVVGRIISGKESLMFDNTQYYYYWVLALVVTASLGGFVKDRYKRKNVDLEDEKQYLDYELEYYKQLNKNGQEIKEIYEQRLLSYENSFGKIANVISELDSLEPQKIFFEAVRVIQRSMNSKGVCIYTYNGENGFARLLASTDKKVWGLGKTFSAKDFPEMMETLNSGEVYINRSLTPKLPIMANALKYEGNIRGIVMIYDLEFESLGLSQKNTFSILTQLIEKSMGRAFEYYGDVRERKYLGETRIMKWEEFIKIVELYCIGEKENLLQYALFKVNTKNVAAKDLQRLVRETDYLGEKRDNEYYLLMTNLSDQDSQVVVDRFRNNQIEIQLCQRMSGMRFEEAYPDLV